jgi:hypothetical protein
MFNSFSNQNQKQNKKNLEDKEAGFSQGGVQ